MPDKDKKGSEAKVPAPETKPQKPGAVKRPPAEWAERLGLTPGKKPHSDLPVGITAAVYSGVCVALGWNAKPAMLTRKKFIDALVSWFRAPTVHSQARVRRFHRRVAAIEAEAVARGVS